MPIDYNAPFKSSMYGIGGVQRPKSAVETIREKQEEKPEYVQKSPLVLLTGAGSTRTGRIVPQNAPETQEAVSKPVVTETGTRTQQAQQQTQKPQAVVLGFPEIQGTQAQQLAQTTKESGRLQVTEQYKGERYPRKTITIGSGGVGYLEKRQMIAEELNLSGWTAEELLPLTRGETAYKTTSEFVYAPRTLSFDTSGNYPAESVLKGGRITLENKYGVMGESFSGGIGKQTIQKESFINKLVPYATLGIFGNKEFRGGVGTALDKAVFSYFRGQGKLTQIGLNPAKLGRKDELTGQYMFDRQRLFRDKDVQTFTAYTLLSPVTQIPAARWAFAFTGIQGGVQAFKASPNLRGAGEASVYTILGISSIPRYNILTRTAMRFSDRYVPLERRNVQFVEGTTIPKNLAELQSLETKNIPTIHVTTARFAREFVITAQTSGAKGFRIQNLLLGFYRSSPAVFRESVVSGYKTSPKFITTLRDFPLLFQQAKTTGTPSKIVFPYQRTSTRAAAYLGYAGIGDTTGSSSGKLIFGNRPVTLLTEKLILEKSPVGANVRETALLQIEKPATYLAPENVFKFSKEGQVYTPPAYDVRTGEIITGNIRAGDVVVGSKVTTFPEQRTFSFYPERRANILTNLIERVSGKTLSREGLTFKTLSSTRFFKLEFLPAKTTPISNEFFISPEQTLKIQKLDLGQYSEFQQSYYGGTRAISPSSALTTSSLISSTPKTTESPMLFSSISSAPSRPSGYWSSRVLSASYKSDISGFSVPSYSYDLSRGGDSSFPSDIVVSSVPSFPSYPSIVSPPSYVSRGGNQPQSPSFVGFPNREFLFRVNFDERKQKVKRKKEKKLKIRSERTGVFVLPDLQAVFQTEAFNYAKFGKGEAIAPRVTKDIYRSALIAFKGYGVGYIPTEQMRTGRIRI